MIAIHNTYLQSIIDQIDLQIARTTEAPGARRHTCIVLSGGITQVPYLEQKIRHTYRGRQDIVEIMAVERPDKPLVALGCILCLRQPGYGGRSIAREAYAIPVARKYDARKHAKQGATNTDRSDLPYKEVRDLADWIVRVGADATPGKEYSDLYVFDFAFENDDGSPCTQDPSKMANPAVTGEFMILSTSNLELSRQKAPSYTNQPLINTRKVLLLKLTRNQVLTIAKTQKYDKIGLWQDDKTKQWFLSTAVRIILDWPDMRLRWRSQIPLTGAFYLPGTKEFDPDLQVWQEEVFLTSPNDHGVHDGDDLDTSMSG